MDREFMSGVGDSWLKWETVAGGRAPALERDSRTRLKVSAKPQHHGMMSAKYKLY